MIFNLIKPHLVKKNVNIYQKGSKLLQVDIAMTVIQIWVELNNLLQNKKILLNEISIIKILF